MDNGSYFIAVKRTFPTVMALVSHYKGEQIIAAFLLLVTVLS